MNVKIPMIAKVMTLIFVIMMSIVAYFLFKQLMKQPQPMPEKNLKHLEECQPKKTATIGIPIPLPNGVTITS